MLNTIDYAILVLLGLSIIISLVRGFVREVLSLITWIAAFWVAIHFAQAFTPMVAKYISTESLRTPAAFIILFIITLIVGALVNYTVSLFVDKTGLSGTDRMLGMVFGVARGIFVIAALLLAATLWTRMPEMGWWKESRLIPQFTPVAHWIKGFVPESFLQKAEQAKAVAETHSALQEKKAEAVPATVAAPAQTSEPKS